MKFLAGIITENEHKFNELTGVRAKYVRVIPEQSYQPTIDGVFIWVKNYAQLLDEQGNETLIESKDSTGAMPIFYSDAEVKTIFESLGQSVVPGDDYLLEFRQMLQTILLGDTMAKGYFNGDTCVPYVPIA